MVCIFTRLCCFVVKYEENENRDVVADDPNRLEIVVT